MKIEMNTCELSIMINQSDNDIEDIVRSFKHALIILGWHPDIVDEYITTDNEYISREDYNELYEANKKLKIDLFEAMETITKLCEKPQDVCGEKYKKLYDAYDKLTIKLAEARSENSELKLNKSCCGNG